MALDRIDLSNVNVCIMGSNVGGVGLGSGDSVFLICSLVMLT